MPFIWLVGGIGLGAYFGAQGDDALEGGEGKPFYGPVMLALAGFGAYAIWKKVAR